MHVGVCVRVRVFVCVCVFEPGDGVKGRGVHILA
jgi:hypothetical protein